MLSENIKRFFFLIGEKNSNHLRYLDKIELSQDDIYEFDKLLLYYIESGVSLEEQRDSYLTILEDTLRETQFFIEYGHYRYNSFDEVKDKVYLNKEYMKKYMIGLALSSYIWIAHIKVRHYFLDYIKTQKSVGKYLEIGPGHGEFFTIALKESAFQSYVGMDLSPTSCELTKNMVEHQVGDLINKCQFLCADFFSYSFNEKVDLIVIGEVLEHVENPLHFLLRAKEILTSQGEIFATIPINAPAIDHIYLFSNPDEVKEMIKKAGLKIKESNYFMANNYSLEKALKLKNAITMTVVLTK